MDEEASNGSGSKRISDGCYKRSNEGAMDQQMDQRVRDGSWRN